ncbi:MAG: hypothetical protein WBO45_05120 [Planctomycetota bacterium]
MAASLGSVLCAQGAVTAPCFVSAFGTALGLGDDQVAPNNALGFTFPGPAGPVTAIDISSNGFVWLGSNTDSGCCNGDVPTFLTGMARIAPMWMDLDPSSGGDVWFNTFPAAGSQPASAVVTWDSVPEYGDIAPMTIQLQLFADGSFAMLFDSNCYSVWHDPLTGVTQGTAAVANPVDYSVIAGGSPHLSGTNPTVHELQLMAFDIAGRAFAFVPNGQGGYIVLARPGCTLAGAVRYGHGCPAPTAGYEFFANPALIDLSNIAIEFTPTAGGGFVALPTTGFFTGYTSSFTFNDDEVLGPFALPFTFPFPGGSTSSIDISSNGFLWLSTGNSDPRCCNGDPATFLADPASIAALWMDLYPPGGGNIYFDTTPTEAHITWAGVPEFFSGPPQTAQITLRSNGTFRLAYGVVSNGGHDVLVGYSQGAVPIDPGSSDFSAGPVIVAAGGAPMALASQPGSRPVIGTTYTMDIDQSTNGAAVGVMVLGATSFNPGIDLTAIGMPGCELYASLDVLLTVLLPAPITPFGLVIPNVPSLAGALIYGQAAALVPTANPLGIATSNGIALTLGV